MFCLKKRSLFLSCFLTFLSFLILFIIFSPSFLMFHRKTFNWFLHTSLWKNVFLGIRDLSISFPYQMNEPIIFIFQIYKVHFCSYIMSNRFHIHLKADFASIFKQYNLYGLKPGNIPQQKSATNKNPQQESATIKIRSQITGCNNKQ